LAVIRKFIAVVTCVAVIAICWTQPDASAQPGKQPTKIMVEKLKFSQKLLEGLALANFDMITRNAEDLIQLTKTEEWQVLKTPKYDLFSNEFRRGAENVIEKAKMKNIDGATLAYFELTMSCVRCHTYVREVRGASLPGGRDVGVGQPAE